MIERVLPGVSVETVAGERAAQQGVTGVVAMPLTLPWGAKVTELSPSDDTRLSLGYRRSDPALKLVNEVLNHANRLILYRLNTGTQATGTISSGLTAKAMYGGARGNDLSVIVEAAGDGWMVKTYLDTVEMDSQTVTSAAGFTANGLITLEGEGALAAKTVKLTGGADGDAESIDSFIAELPLHEYNLVAYTGTSAEDVQKLVGYVKERRDPEVCDMIQLVQSVTATDNEAVYHSTVGGKTADYELTPAEACATMAGILSRCGISDSATNFDDVAGWIDVSPRLTVEQQKARTRAGEILFVLRGSVVKVLYDVNSLTTITSERPKDWKKGLVVRTHDKYAKDLQLLLEEKVIGYRGTRSGIRNSVEGRNLVKGMIAKMTAEEYVDPGYIARKSEDDPGGFSADDISVRLGAERDAIDVKVGIKPNDAIDKIYVTVVSQ